MNQIFVTSAYSEKTKQSDGSNRFETCEQVVADMVETGLPDSFTYATYISKISNKYGISLQEARTCLKLAEKQLENNPIQNNNTKEEDKRYAESGYFYPSSLNSQIKTQEQAPQAIKHNDGMDNLSAFGAYNKLMFGIR